MLPECIGTHSNCRINQNCQSVAELIFARNYPIQMEAPPVHVPAFQRYRKLISPKLPPQIDSLHFVRILLPRLPIQFWPICPLPLPHSVAIGIIDRLAKWKFWIKKKLWNGKWRKECMRPFAWATVPHIFAIHNNLNDKDWPIWRN